MVSQMHYLTVQDILWINLQVTEKVHHFNYAKLEEATYYQYAYGDSKQLVSQASRFLTGFLRMSPFESGNEATAFIGCLAFLSINGMRIDLLDRNAVTWFEAATTKKGETENAIKSIAKPIVGHHDHPVSVRATVKELLGDYACSLLQF